MEVVNTIIITIIDAFIGGFFLSEFIDNYKKNRYFVACVYLLSTIPSVVQIIQSTWYLYRR